MPDFLAKPAWPFADRYCCFRTDANTVTVFLAAIRALAWPAIGFRGVRIAIGSRSGSWIRWPLCPSALVFLKRGNQSLYIANAGKHGVEVDAVFLCTGGWAEKSGRGTVLVFLVYALESTSRPLDGQQSRGGHHNEIAEL